jgi:hypothetical protein
MQTTPPHPAEGAEAKARSPMRVKVSFNLPLDELEDLRELAARRNDTVTDTLRRAIALEMLADEVEQSGSKLLIRDPDGEMREIILR